jgi:hypothetical protein
MKKNIILFVSVVLFVSCESSSVSEKTVQNDSKKELVALNQETIVAVLKISKRSDFKQFVLDECLKQEHGDYNVYFSKIISAYNGKDDYFQFITEITKLRTKIMALNGGLEPIIFYPKAEMIEASNELQGKGNAAKIVIPPADPIAVDGNVFNPDYSSPGYIVSNNGDLTYYDDITEDYAWENDVWVIGQEENVTNKSSAGDDVYTVPVSNSASRYQGQGEYGGIIQVTDLNAIEPWIAGKLEFRILIYGANGTLLADKSFDKRKRSRFRNQKWYDYGFFVGNWNTSTFGNSMTEKWMELDGGKSNQIAYTIPPPSSGGVAITVTSQSQDKDDDLGLTTIQFTDAISQVYGISHANIKRRHQ